MEKTKHVVVIGSGLAGLASACELSVRGFQVTVIEMSPKPGGLAGSTEISGSVVDRYYHFISRIDSDLISAISELGLDHQLFWNATRTGYFIDRKIFTFDTPFDLLTTG
jgi:protoporphyrinogen oxidase